MGKTLILRKVEEGNWETHLLKENKQKKELTLRISVLAYKAFLVLLSLAGLAVYAATVGAISCRMLDIMIRRENCHVTSKPFASLWRASIYAMLALNGAAAAVFVQCLMLTFRLGETRSAWPGEKFRQKLNIFSVNEIERCHVHQADFVQKLTYRTRCCDDVIIRTRFPAQRPYSETIRGSQTLDSVQYAPRMSESRQSTQLELRNRRKSSRRQSQSEEAAQQIPMVVTQGSVQIDESGLRKNFYGR
ncbi:hypothetical protein BOX15_Mlig027286g1 [Macrostomum lignano]|uniref:Uncharacterized protein n=2 Tax=Macrostomum lignano TaxID=282301 RepID=A0A267H4F1_9PLAT|nr:hypothetical protein BOX15_Mlig027286g1 [Macrostomum lignano]